MCEWINTIHFALVTCIVPFARHMTDEQRNKKENKKTKAYAAERRTRCCRENV